MNRLAREQSPYLLQHANNPVDWLPWGDEAFARARQEDKPIFLSIGYSTCHWCHVMEHESFEQPAIAAILNQHFVSIKVDREERPDVDRVYMAFVQGTTGSGGWPMSVWLTPDLKPFYGGTYYPPSSRWGRPGFAHVLTGVARAWHDQRDQLVSSAESVIEQMRGAAAAVDPASLPDNQILARIASEFARTFDRQHGGFGGAPKFPRPSELLLLLREYVRTSDDGLRDMVLTTLRAMALGGMRDHIGGGFHRYSVDVAWRVPHFEKMLYDQAQLVLAFLEAAQASSDPFYIEVAEDTLRYVIRQMTGQEGGFHSAEDADSIPPELADAPQPRRTEGAYYLWRASEIDALLAPAEAAIVKRRFGVEPDGNAPSDPQEEFTGRNLLYAAVSIGALAAEFGCSEAEISAVLGRARRTLFQARLKRPRPHLDDKVLTSWNGLMIAAFARVARVIRAFGAEGGDAGQPYLDAARKAAGFIRARMWNPETRTLLHRFRAGDAQIEGYAEDYAYLIFGLLELFQADPDVRWLEWAIALQRRQDELFWDADEGGWFSTTGSDPSVLLRMKDEHDGAEPSASSISVLNLLTLSHLVDQDDWQRQIDKTLTLFRPRLEQIGRTLPMMACALSASLAGVEQIVICAPDHAELAHDDGPAAESQEGAQALLRVVAVRYRPFAVVLSLSPQQRAALSSLAPLLSAMLPAGGRATAYVCRNFACRQPVTSTAALQTELAVNERSETTVEPDRSART